MQRTKGSIPGTPRGIGSEGTTTTLKSSEDDGAFDWKEERCRAACRQAALRADIIRATSTSSTTSSTSALRGSELMDLLLTRFSPEGE